MTDAIKVIRTEKECVIRQNTDKCNRCCEDCDLLLPTEDVLRGYNMAISILEQWSAIKKLTEGMREVTPEESKSIEEYLSRTSKKTGVNIFDLLDDKSCEECRNNHTSICGNCKDFDEFEEIDFVQPHKKIPVTLDLTPCEDAVSREAILNKIKEVCFSKEWLQFRIDKGSNGQRDFLINYIRHLPSVTVRQTDDDPYQTDMDDAWEQAKRAEWQSKVFGYDAYKDIRETLVNLTVKGYTRSMIQTVLEQMPQESEE